MPRANMLIVVVMMSVALLLLLCVWISIRNQPRISTRQDDYGTNGQKGGIGRFPPSLWRSQLVQDGVGALQTFHAPFVVVVRCLVICCLATTILLWK